MQIRLPEKNPDENIIRIVCLIISWLWFLHRAIWVVVSPHMVRGLSSCVIFTMICRLSLCVCLGCVVCHWSWVSLAVFVNIIHTNNLHIVRRTIMLGHTAIFLVIIITVMNAV